MIPKIEVNPGQWVFASDIRRELRTGQTYYWRYPTAFAGKDHVQDGTVRRGKSGYWHVEPKGLPACTVKAKNVHGAIVRCVPEG